ncbi:MAG TPA: hypothetical protein PLT08_13270 [Anaerolineales bacterium]|nr:hypothetical protein [Anaerolineales bacterium]
MELSRKKEAFTIVTSGFIPVILIALGFSFFTANGACFPMSFFIAGGWLGIFLVSLIFSGYGAFVGWTGFRDVSFNKKLSAKTMALTIIGLLGIFAFLFPVCD